MNGIKFVIIITTASIGLLGGGLYLVSKTNQTASVQASTMVKTQVPVTNHDWGTIMMKNGDVKAVYQIKNAGSEDLKLYNVATSCSCTTAQLKLGNMESPLFSMHGKSDYVMAVPPGQTAELEMVFDPAFHGPTGTGAIERQAKIQTNDATVPVITLQAKAVVTN